MEHQEEVALEGEDKPLAQPSDLAQGPPLKRLHRGFDAAQQGHPAQPQPLQLLAGQQPLQGPAVDGDIGSSGMLAQCRASR